MKINSYSRACSTYYTVLYIVSLFIAVITDRVKVKGLLTFVINVRYRVRYKARYREPVRLPKKRG